MRCTLAVLLGSISLFAQLPQAAWEGEVDGRVEVTIRGDRMDTRELSGPATNALRFRVYDPLPARDGQQVRLQNQQGRGSIRITQQPDRNNGYAAVVTIDDPQGGRGMYAFQLAWDVSQPYPANTNAPTATGRRYTIVDDRNPRNPAPSGYGGGSSGGGWASPSTAVSNSSGNGEFLRWTGTVDDEAIIECRQRDCYPTVQRGANVVRDRVEYTRELPAQDTRIDLTETRGRGEIRLLEPASRNNNWTTRIKIRDTDGGAGDYAFTLRWIAPVITQSTATGLGMRWTGRVDGKVRVIVEGARTYLETLAGAPVTDERATFDRTVPAYDGLRATVTKRRGRGRVELVEYPSNRNNYRIVFTIDDDKGGADNYEVEVGW